MSRRDEYSVTVSVDGVNLGVFDSQGGGGVDSNEIKYKPGNMGPEISLGGTQTTDNVTVSRLYIRERDHELARSLFGKCGKAPMVVKRQPLDADGLPFGSPHVYTGTLKACQAPEPDSTSNEAGMLTLEMTTAGTVA